MTPEQMDKVNKSRQSDVQRALKNCKKRKPAVAPDATNNGESALSAELQSQVGRQTAPRTATTNSVARPTARVVPARRKTAPVPIVEGPPRLKCQGCVHGDLLEMKDMTPAHIKHYLKANAFLEVAKCAGEDCGKTIKHIHTTDPKAKLYYCDIANKGFYAPEDDPKKVSMECGLILCLACYKKRETKYEQEKGGDGSANRRTSRRSNKTS